MTKPSRNSAPIVVSSPSTAGYRMPGEFEPVEALWLTYPHNRDTWPGCFDAARRQFDEFIRQARRFVKVNVIGRDFQWTTNDSWIRDYGPIFVVRLDAAGAGGGGGGKGLACHDFRFNGWGGKYDSDDYQPELDDVIPQFIAKELKIPVWSHDLILEGGSIEVNGAGTVMTTEQCLLNQNRNAKLSRGQIEAALHDALGTRHVVWLPGGIEGDDTDGHVDDVARFIAVDTVVAVRAPADHPDHAMLDRNWRALEGSRDQDGQPLKVLALPAPPQMWYDYPPRGGDPGGRQPLPASHANFLMLNEGVLVPTFDQPTDEAAMLVLAQALPGRQVIGVRAEHLVVGCGSLHCLSMQQPRV